MLYPSGYVPKLEHLRDALVGRGSGTGEGKGGGPGPGKGESELDLPIGCERIVNSASGYPAFEYTIAGLGFELAAIGPWNREECPPIQHTFGIAVETIGARSGVSIVPGPNIATIAHSLEVVRAGAALARHIVASGDPLAVVWRPIGSAMEAAYFTRLAEDWLAGGPFPALGLTSLRDAPDGGLHSHGLALFAGQELRLVPAIAESGVEALALGARLIDRLVGSAPIASAVELQSEDGRMLRLTPSSNGRFVVADWSE